MKGEIIAIGNELVSGRVQDKNTFFLAQRLSRYGLEISSIRIIQDNEQAIVECLKNACNRSTFVIVTGGLGPTEDDLTVRAASKAFGLPLKRDPVSWKILKDYTESHNIPLYDNVKKMANLPEGARKLDPKTPRAGFSLEFNGCFFYFLPGVPEEVRELFDRVVLEELLNKCGSRPRVLTRIIKVFGLRESEIENRILDILPNFDTVSVSYLPCFPEHHLHVTAKGKEEKEAEKEFLEFVSLVSERLGDFVYGYDEDSLESVVGDLLRSENFTLSIAESCTGGLIGHRITNVPGSSDYFKLGVVVYSNEVKESVLGVDRELLVRFGAVSEQVARAMCEGVKKLGETHYSVATTGIAGPTGGTPDKPVGTVYIAISGPDTTFVRKYLFSGSRTEIKTMTSQVALDTLRRTLLKMAEK